MAADERHYKPMVLEEDGTLDHRQVLSDSCNVQPLILALMASAVNQVQVLA